MRADDQNDRQTKKRTVTARAAALIRSIRETSIHTIAWSVVTTAIGAATSAAKFYAGIASRSAFLTAGAIYGAALSVARAAVLRQFALQKSIADEREKCCAQCRAYRKSGVFLLVLGISYFGVCACVLFLNAVYPAPRLAVWLFVLTAAGKLAFALFGWVRMRKKKKRLVQALKLLSAADAVVSVSAAAGAMTTQRFGAALGACSAAGMVVCGAWVKKRTRCATCRENRENKNGS